MITRLVQAVGGHATAAASVLVKRPHRPHLMVLLLLVMLRLLLVIQRRMVIVLRRLMMMSAGSATMQVGVT